MNRKDIKEIKIEKEIIEKQPTELHIKITKSHTMKMCLKILKQQEPKSGSMSPRRKMKTKNLLNKNQKKIPISLYSTKYECKVNIQFTKNTYNICQDKCKDGNVLHILKDLVENPNHFPFYEIQFQNQTYPLLFESLFSLIMFEFRKKISDDYSIVKVIVKSEKDSFDPIVIERIHQSLLFLKFNVDFNIEKLRDIYDLYQQQELFLHEILLKKEQYEQFIIHIERAKSFILQSENVELEMKLPLFSIRYDDVYTDKLYDEILLKLTIEQQKQLKLSQLNNICLQIASKYLNTIDDYINLTLSSRKHQNLMETYSYNPISLTSTTKKFFPNISTLFVYRINDNQFHDDKRIKERTTFYDVSEESCEQLEKWTSMKCGDVLFDSHKDNWNIQTSVFDQKIIGKSKIIFLIEETNGNQFGYYLDSEITSDYKQWIETTPNSFLFSLESNGRLGKPTKFEMINPRWGYSLENNSKDILISLGGYPAIVLYKEHKKKESYYYQDSNSFDYHKIKNPFCEDTQFTPKRILVIQMI